MKNLETWTETAESSLTNIIQEKEERQNSNWDKVEWIDVLVKKLNIKNSSTKYAWSLGHWGKKQNLLETQVKSQENIFKKYRMKFP